jgi:aspartyl-tRNA(Asn)/glutamyl-tRNA(Gln) amidotransferase subunit B
VSQSAAKEVLDVLAAEGGSPQAIVENRSLGLGDAGDLAEIVDRAIEQNADAVEQIKAGKDRAIGAIVGAVMRETKGRADGGEVQRMIQERIG